MDNGANGCAPHTAKRAEQARATPSRMGCAALMSAMVTRGGARVLSAGLSVGRAVTAATATAAVMTATAMAANAPTLAAGSLAAGSPAAESPAAGTSAAAPVAPTAFPQKPVTVIVPQAPGGTNDIVARVVGAAMGEDLKQPFVITNRPGAGGNVGTVEARRASADGYTVLATISSTQAISPVLFKDPGFDPVKDFTPVAMLGVVPNVLLVHPSFPAKNLDEFIALVKADPGKYQYASAGNGSLNHLLGAMLDQRAGLRLEHIPYRGVAPAMADVLGNQVPIVFASLPSALPNIREGKLRALGVSTTSRSPALPEVPAIGEKIPGYGGDLWIALFTRAGTPQPVVDTLSQSAARVLALPATQRKLSELGVEPLSDTPAQLTERLQRDIATWREIVQASGARVD